MTRYAMYPRDVTHMNGQVLRLPRVMVGGGLREVLWKVVDAQYNFQSDMTRLKLERVIPDE